MPKKLPERIGRSCGVMIVAADATGKAPPTVRVRAFTALAFDSLQMTVVSPSGVIATVGASEINAGSEMVWAELQVPAVERVCVRTIELVKLQAKRTQLVWNCIQTIVTVPSSATA